MSNGRYRRSSIFTGLLLVLLGVLFLAERLNPALGIGHLIRLYWPVLLILWGVAKLVDYLWAQRAGQPRAHFLSGGEAALLVLLALILSGFVFRDWVREHGPDFDIRVPPFHDSYSQSRQLAPKTIPAGARVVIDLERGDINVHGAPGGELTVGVHESAWATSEAMAQERMKDVDVVIEEAGDAFVVRPVRQGGSSRRVRVDIDVQVPKTSSVTLHTARGDIRATGIAAKIEARTESGDVEVRDAGSDVSVALRRGDARITHIGGSVRLMGRGSDVEIADVAGDATVDGMFLGSGAVRNVKGTTRCTSPWWDVSVGRLSGSLEGEMGAIKISDAAGPARIVTHNKDIELRNVTGRLEVTSGRGDVKVHYSSPPLEDVNISNNAGDVELTLPGNSRFAVSAVSRSGEVQSEFAAPSLQTAVEEANGRLTGEFGGKPGSPEPRITIATSYGTIRLRKSD